MQIVRRTGYTLLWLLEANNALSVSICIIFQSRDVCVVLIANGNPAKNSPAVAIDMTRC